MKKIYLLAAGLLLIALTITSVNAEDAKTPNNPNNTLENKIQVINQMVKDGELEESLAKEIKSELENCDGSGSKKIGKKYNIHFGQKLGNGQGRRFNNN